VTDVADIQPLMERAEQAAHRGDFAAAEEALRLAVELQERTLGASSPEVASTLNNLGIVYERLDRPEDAESSYRKAFAIAKAVFAPDHPLVETSANNLREFCHARGIPFEQKEPVAEQMEPVAVSARAETPPAVPSSPAREVPPEPAAATPPGSSGGPIVLGAAVVLAIAAGIFFASHRATAPVSPPASSAAVPAAPPVEPEAAPRAPAPAPAQPASPPVAVTKPASKPSPPAVTPRPAPPQTAQRVAVVETLDARLCQSLDIAANWRCDPLPESAASGPVFFVTRLKSATDTSVEHRWYRNGKLSHSVTLHVPATGSGYRTYSRMTASRDRSGTWRVEVRDTAGTVLDSRTFVVGPS